MSVGKFVADVVDYFPVNSGITISLIMCMSPNYYLSLVNFVVILNNEGGAEPGL